MNNIDTNNSIDKSIENNIDSNIDKIFDKIYSNIKYHRSLTGLTQEDYAEMIGISSQYVSKIERGEATPSLNLLLTICYVFDYSIYSIIPQTKTDCTGSLNSKMTLKFDNLSNVQKEKIISLIDWYSENH